MDILLYVLVAIAFAVIVLLAVASRRPDDFAYERTMRMQASPERIFPLIADLKAMNTWNPFVEPDPQIRLTYSNPSSGPGAKNEWTGNRHVGAGRISIVDAQAPKKVAMRLEMWKPMKADNAVVFTLRPNGSGTDVSWRMTGRQPLMAKVMTMFIDCEKMVGGQFDKGLAKLKGIVERAV